MLVSLVNRSWRFFLFQTKHIFAYVPHIFSTYEFFFKETICVDIILRNSVLIKNEPLHTEGVFIFSYISTREFENSVLPLYLARSRMYETGALYMITHTPQGFES